MDIIFGMLQLLASFSSIHAQREEN